MARSTIGSIFIDTDNEQALDESGRKLDLRAQTFKVFAYLCKNRGRLVSKNELLEGLWVGLIVTEDSVVKCISEIRKELNGCNSNIDLKTIAKKGYQLTESSPDSTDRIEIPTLVVWPFKCLNNDAEVFAAGLTEDVTTLLCQHKDIFVVAPHSAIYASREHKGISLDEISESLGVRYVLQASVQEADNTLRVNAYLSDVVNDARIWSEKYEETTGNLLQAQDAISTKIVNRICGSASVVISAERIKLTRATPSNPAAYQLYVMASDIDRAFTKSGTLETIENYERVVKLDPTFARAWMRLAAMHFYAAACAYTDDVKTTIESMVSCALRAAELDSNDSLIQGLAGAAYCFLDQPTIAAECFNRALSLGPNDADTLAMLAFIRPTKFPTVEVDLENIRRARSLNLFHPKWYSLAHGYAAYHSKNYVEAITALEQAGFDFLDTNLYLTLCYAEIGDRTKMEAHKSALLKMNPHISASMIIEGDNMKEPGVIEHFEQSFRKAGL